MSTAVPPKLTEAYRLRARVERLFRAGVRDFSLIEPGDAVLVGLSGGKDSMALLELLGTMRRHTNGSFRLEAVHVTCSASSKACSARTRSRFIPVSMQGVSGCR